MLVGCSLAAIVARPPRCVARMLRGARPFPLPLALPLPARPFGAEWCPAFGGAFLCGGPPFPAPPAPPSPYMCPYLGVCVRPCVGVCIHRGCVVGGGFRGPSVVLRPPRFGADAGCRPMCPASRLRPPLAFALGRCAPRLPVLGSLCSLRFKRACGGCSVPFRLAVARCGLSLAHFGARFCHFNMTKP